MDLFRQAAEQYSAVGGSEGKHEEVVALLHAFLQSDRVQHILNQPDPASPDPASPAAVAPAAAAAASAALASPPDPSADAAPPPPPMTTSASDEAAVGFHESAPLVAEPVGSTHFMIDDDDLSAEAKVRRGNECAPPPLPPPPEYCLCKSTLRHSRFHRVS
jgi:hypothetical protein